jgi:uncharacterized protein YjcR
MDLCNSIEAWKARLDGYRAELKALTKLARLDGPSDIQAVNYSKVGSGGFYQMPLMEALEKMHKIKSHILLHEEAIAHLEESKRKMEEKVSELSGLDIEDPIEKLWRTICLHEARIIYMQDIMHVKNKNDMTKELKKISDGKGGSSKEYEIQFAWDKEANLMNTQSKSIAVLAKLIKDYNEMLHANWDTATEEQKLRVERLRVQIQNPELQHRKEHNAKKLQLDRERLEHTKEMDKAKVW